jgi:hypothetical protein
LTDSDSAWYGTGASELNIGTVMKKRRHEVFLASKSHDYTYDGTMALFDQSLKRLQTTTSTCISTICSDDSQSSSNCSRSTAPARHSSGSATRVRSGTSA